jgi:hypothetical protein
MWLCPLLQGSSRRGAGHAVIYRYVTLVVDSLKGVLPTRAAVVCFRYAMVVPSVVLP